MNEISTVALTACAASIVCSLLSGFVHGENKRLLGLVMGAFMLCSLIAPVKKAVSGFELKSKDYSLSEQEASFDEVYQLRVIAETKENLEKTLSDILLQNGIEVNSCTIILSDSGSGGIIIASADIYINSEQAPKAELVRELTEKNLGITPNVFYGEEYD